MTMLSFRTNQEEAAQIECWARRLGIDRSELLRTAVRAHMVRLASELDADTWERVPLDEGERAVAGISAWGPAEDWSDWGRGQELPDRADAPR